jgi:hypothetical protein
LLDEIYQVNDAFPNKLKQRQTSTQEWVPNTYLAVLMKSELTLRIMMGYNFNNGLLLTRKSYVA